MPIHRVAGGYKWGKHGKVYKSRAGAERQQAAIYANGYKGDQAGPGKAERYEADRSTPPFAITTAAARGSGITDPDPPTDPLLPHAFGSPAHPGEWPKKPSDTGMPNSPIGSAKDRRGDAYKEVPLPKNHRPLMQVPKGGSSCSNCVYLKPDNMCGNQNYLDYYGTSVLPGPPDRLCSDWWEPKP